MTFKHLRLPKTDGPLPSCINWKWVEVTAQGEFKAHYCVEGVCRDLGIFKSADSANLEVIKAIRAHINQEVGHLVKKQSNQNPSSRLKLRYCHNNSELIDMKIILIGLMNSLYKPSRSLYQ